MSRAFVKERDDEPSPRFAEPAAPHVVTAAGLRRLRARAAVASSAENVVLGRRIAAARLAAAPANRATVAFGATVTIADGNDRTRTFSISGVDDVDIAAGRIGADSPLARALLGRRIGHRVVWRRPAGDERVTIVAVDYGELD